VSTGSARRDPTLTLAVELHPSGAWSPAAGGRAETTVPVPGASYGDATEEAPVAVRDQVVRAVALAWRNGVGEARLRLTPEHLGEVLVRLRIEQGAVQAVVQAQTAEAKERIQAHESELRAALSELGLDLDRLAVTLDPDDRQGQSAPRRRPPVRTSKRIEDDQGPRFVVSA
jgi:flagellar hook-length control protein FliK